MKAYSISQEINATPARIWTVMREVERWHEWTASITSVQRLDSGPFGLGSQVIIRQPGFPPAKWRVSAFAVNVGFEWIARSPGILVIGRHAIEPTATGSRVTLSIEYSGVIGSLLGFLTGDVNQRYIATEMAGLKARSEDTMTNQ